MPMVGCLLVLVVGLTVEKLLGFSTEFAAPAPRYVQLVTKASRCSSS
jgi:hypothetical protein